MSGTLVMKSSDRWYKVKIKFKGIKRAVLPVLEEYWNVQEGPDRIIKTCGAGILMVFLRMPFEDIPEDDALWNILEKGGQDPDKRMDVWHNGDQFDHSSNACLSPVDKYKSKMVLDNYSNGSPIQVSFDTKDEAMAKDKSRNVYVWDGESWAFESVDPSSRHNPFKRSKNRWGRER